MSDKSAIEWTDATWNPVTGCTKVTPGCDHCYAETFAERFRGVPGHHFEQGFDLTLRPERLDQPLRWRRPRRIFVNSMSDLFHDGVPDEYIARVFAVMAESPWHVFQLLTKRHGRMRSLLSSPRFAELVDRAICDLPDQTTARLLADNDWHLPLPNVWLGVSVEDQKRADLRIPALLGTPAAVRWISAEPLLGPVDLMSVPPRIGGIPRLDWVVVGGESGPGARPMHPDWARSLRDQCQEVGVPFLFKQWGEYRPVPVVDDPTFSCDRAFDHPKGGRVAAIIRPRATRAFESPRSRPMRAGDRNGHGVMLDDNTIAVPVGKKLAGRELDGRTWDEYPSERTVAPA